MYNNTTLNRLLEFNKISDEEYELLFIDKSKWNSEDSEFNNAKKFWSTISKIKDILDSKNIRETLKLSPKDSLYNFSYIKFPDMESSAIYEEYIYPDYENEGHNYDKPTDFSNCIFEGNANFKNVIFGDEVKFNDTVFKQNANFSDALFEGDSYFKNAVFFNEISFENCECKGIFDFSDTAFSSLLLDKSSFPHASYLRLDGWNKNIHEDIARERLSAKNFQTKESARIIKTHFEKNNNIIESNVYYPIEIEKYREELSNWSNPIISFTTNQDYFVTTLHKYISNYGTDWIRPLLVMFIFGFFSGFIYHLFPLPNNIDSTNILLHTVHVPLFTLFGLILGILFYLVYILKEWILLTLLPIVYFIGLIVFPELRSINNDIAKLVNPLNIFKGKDYFEHIAPYGMFVKLIMSVLIYQFIIAFRQNTRRK